MSTARLLVPAAFPPSAVGLPLASTPPHEQFQPSAPPCPMADDTAGHGSAPPAAPSTPPSPSHTSTTKSARSRTSADGDTWAPRPPNAWILYRSDKSQELKRRKASNPELAPMSSRQRQAEMSREISVLWKHESKSVKDHYARRAEKERADHRQRYPNYKYCPKRRSADTSRSMYAQRRHSSFDPLQLSLAREQPVATAAAAAAAAATRAAGAPDSRASFAGYTSTTPHPRSADQAAATLHYARRSAQAEPYYMPSTSVAASYAPSAGLPDAPAPGPASTVQLHRSSAPPSAHSFPAMQPTYSPTYSYSTDLPTLTAQVTAPASTPAPGSDLDLRSSLPRPQSQPGLSSAPFAFAPPHSPHEFDVGCSTPLPLSMSSSGGGLPMKASISRDSSISDLPTYTATATGGKYDPSFSSALLGSGSAQHQADDPAGITLPLCPPQLDTPLSLLGTWGHLDRGEPQAFRPTFTTHALGQDVKWEEQSPLSLHHTLPSNTLPHCMFPDGLVAFSSPAPNARLDQDGPPFAPAPPTSGSAPAPVSGSGPAPPAPACPSIPTSSLLFAPPPI